MEVIGGATGCSSDAVRAFLASREGQRFGEAVATALDGRDQVPDAIAAVVAAWMSRPVGERNEEELGIPAALPYLQGFILMQEALIDLGLVERNVSATPSRALAEPATE